MYFRCGSIFKLHSKVCLREESLMFWRDLKVKLLSGTLLASRRKPGFAFLVSLTFLRGRGVCGWVLTRWPPELPCNLNYSVHVHARMDVHKEHVQQLQYLSTLTYGYLLKTRHQSIICARHLRKIKTLIAEERNNNGSALRGIKRLLLILVQVCLEHVIKPSVSGLQKAISS